MPTPWKDDHIDLDPLRDAMRAIPGEKIVAIRSTVPIGTTDAIQDENPHHRVYFVPEFLTEATADADTRHPRVTIVGYRRYENRQSRTT